MPSVVSRLVLVTAESAVEMRLASKLFIRHRFPAEGIARIRECRGLFDQPEVLSKVLRRIDFRLHHLERNLVFKLRRLTKRVVLLGETNDHVDQTVSDHRGKRS